MSTRGGPLPAADLGRLRAALQTHDVDPYRSLFGPASMTWKVNRETVLLLGGARALLMQVAHPLVAAGVAEHSEFRRDPLKRLWRTLDLTLTITFSEAREAVRAVRQIERVHARVRGRLGARVGPFERGTPYSADDPELLFWVHATLVDTALLVYERFVDRLSVQQRRVYYEESKITARLFGVPDERIPADYDEFRGYMRRMLAGETLAVGPQSRAVGTAVLWPERPIGLKEALWVPNALTMSLLPPMLRRRYAVPFVPGRRKIAHGLSGLVQFLLPWAPEVLRVFPQARRPGVRS